MQENDTAAQTSRQKTFSLLLLAAAVVIGIGIRALDLSRLPLSFDEAASVYIAKRPLAEVIEKNGAFNSSPPAMLIVLHAVLKLGRSEAFVRAVSVLSGIATIPLVFLIVRQLRPVGYAPAMAALLFALSAQQIALSREFRVYALGELFGALGLLAVLQLARRPSWMRAGVTSLIFFLGIQVQYAVAPFFAAAGLALLVGRTALSGRRQVPWKYLVPVAASAALATVVVYETALKYQLYAGRGSSYTPSVRAGSSAVHETVLILLAQTFSLIQYGLRLQGIPWSGVALTLFCLYGAARLACSCPRRPYLLTTAFSLLGFMALTAANYYPFGATRQCLILTLPFYGLAAAGVIDGVSGESKLQRGVALLILLLAAFGFAMNRIRSPGAPSSIETADIREGMRRLQQNWRPGDVVFIPPGTFPIAHYYRDLMPPQPWVEAEGSMNWMQDERAWRAWMGAEPPYADQLDQLLRSNSRVWMLYSHYHPGEMTLDDLAASRGWSDEIRTMMQSRQSDDSGEGNELYLFERRRTPDPERTPM